MRDHGGKRPDQEGSEYKELSFLGSEFGWGVGAYHWQGNSDFQPPDGTEATCSSVSMSVSLVFLPVTFSQGIL